LAELRGRVFYGPADPGRISEDATGTTRTGFMPPLGEERTAAEQLVEIKTLVRELSTSIGITTDGSKMADAHGKDPTAPCTGFQRVLELADQVPWQEPDEVRLRNWIAFAEAFYALDSQIQNELNAANFGECSAYQLGRGLAETSWSMDLNARTKSTTSLDNLLGPERSVILTGLIVRLTPVAMSADVSQAIKGSLAEWQRRVEGSDAPHGDGVVAVYLRRQVTLWRDLLLSGADTQALIRPAAPLRRVATIFPALRTLWPQALLGLVGSGLIGWAAYLLTETHPKGIQSTIVTALGIFGVTAATVTAKAKSTANHLLGSIQSAVAADLLVEGATILPPDKKGPLPTRYRAGESAAPVTMASMTESLSKREAPAPVHLTA
jgi:hypothetical protein